MNNLITFKIEKSYKNDLLLLKKYFRVTTMREALRFCIQQSIGLSQNRQSILTAQNDLNALKQALKSFFEQQKYLQELVIDHKFTNFNHPL
jgi:hypothetical protein